MSCKKRENTPERVTRGGSFPICQSTQNRQRVCLRASSCTDIYYPNTARVSISNICLCLPASRRQRTFSSICQHTAADFVFHLANIPIFHLSANIATFVATDPSSKSLEKQKLPAFFLFWFNHLRKYATPAPFSHL